MKIGIVGAGAVGSAAAFALVMRELGSEILLVDTNTSLAQAQAQDILHAVPFAGATSIRAGDIDDLDGAGIVILAAGVNQKPGEGRLELQGRNAAIFRGLVPEIRKAAPEAILLVATNPVDIMTQVTSTVSGLPAEQVIGSGTILDTARFRSLIGHHLGIAAQSVHAYVLGEHGDSEVLQWSGAEAGGIPIELLGEQLGLRFTEENRRAIDQGVRQAANRIIVGKGATCYGIAGGLARIVAAIVNDQKVVLTTSIINAEIEGVQNVALSLPRVIGRNGVEATLMPSLINLERAALQRSAAILKEAVNRLDMPM